MAKFEAALLAWHYTTGENFERIVTVGFLQPSAIDVQPSERPVLWFSLEQHWEPTACKAWDEGGRLRLLTMEETRERGRGLVRFGVASERLTPWPRIRAIARIPPRIAQGLIRRAEEQGASPHFWLGTTSALPLEQIEAIDVMEDSAWVRVRPKSASSL